MNKDKIILEKANSLFSFLFFFYRKEKIYLFLMFFIAILLGTTNVIDAYLKKLLINELTALSPNISSIWRNFWLIILFYCLNHLYFRSSNLIEIKIGNKIKCNIIEKSFLYINSQSYKFFQNNLSGSLSFNIMNLAENIQILVHKYFISFMRSFIQTIFVLWAMYLINPIFSLILSVWIIFFIGSSVVFLKKFRLASKDYNEISARVSGKIVDSIANFLNIKLFASIFFEKRKLREVFNEMEEKFQKKNKILLFINIFQGVSIALTFCLVLSFLIKLKLSRQISIGDFIMIIGLFFHVSENIWWISEYIGTVSEIFGKCKQSLEKIFTPIEISDREDAKDLIIKNAKIEFKNVYFGYSYKDEKPLFQDISLKINGGKKIGLVGYSGSGKSTFVNLILRLFDLKSGEILIDDQNISFITQDSLRKQIAVIPQDPFLFHRSIFENIEYGIINPELMNEEEKKQKVIDAAKSAKAHDFIINLQNGYDTLVGERGIKLSGGQKQRIAIARAILKNTPILILDEATSALDSVIEGDIQNELIQVMKEKTVIVIAHRLSTLLSMDEIFVFDDGKIVEIGNHKELLLKQDGLYKKLWDAQVGGFLPTIIT